MYVGYYSYSHPIKSSIYDIADYVIETNISYHCVEEIIDKNTMDIKEIVEVEKISIVTYEWVNRQEIL